MEKDKIMIIMRAFYMWEWDNKPLKFCAFVLSFLIKLSK